MELTWEGRFTLMAAVLASLLGTGCAGPTEPASEAAQMPLGSVSEAETLGGLTTDGPAVASPAPHRYDVYFVNGGTLYHQRFLAGRWSSASVIATGLTSKVAAVSWGEGRVDLVARGSSNQALHWWGNGDTFSGPESLGGSLLYGPAIASAGPGNLEVFAIGPDHQLFMRRYGPSGWGTYWYALGGYATSSPGAVSMDSSSTDVFVRGPDNALWHRWRRGTTWYGYESLGGTLASAPAAASFVPGRLEVYVRDTADGVSARSWSAAGWTAWKPVPVSNGVSSDPGAIRTDGEECDHLFFRQPDGNLGHRGCGDTNVVTLGPVMANPGSFETSVFSQDLLVASGRPVYQAQLEGMWPRELLMLDTFDTEDLPFPMNQFPAIIPGPLQRGYSTLPGWQHVSSGGLELEPDHGPFMAGASSPFQVQQARLIDHGACSIKTRWTESVYDYPQQGYYPDPEGVGVLGGVFIQIYDGILNEVMGDPTKPIHVSEIYKNSFTLEPTFLTPAGSTDLRANHDGFGLSFNLTLHIATPSPLPDVSAEMSGAANYTLGLDSQGLLTVTPVGAIAANLDTDFAGDVATLGLELFGKPVQSSSDVRTSLAGLGQTVRKKFLDQLTVTGLCNPTLDPAGQAASCASDAVTPMKIQLRSAMIAQGMSAAAADSTADEITSRLTPANFVCVPVSEEPDSTSGQCRYHPAFKRVNVLPEGFELVVSESDELLNNDVRILSFLSPSTYQACQNTYRPAPIPHRHLYRFDYATWMGG